MGRQKSNTIPLKLFLSLKKKLQWVNKITFQLHEYFLFVKLFFKRNIKVLQKGSFLKSYFLITCVKTTFDVFKNSFLYLNEVSRVYSKAASGSTVQDKADPDKKINGLN